MAASIGSLIATLALDTAKFTAGIRVSNRAMRRFQRNMQKRMKAVRRGIMVVTKAIAAMSLALVSMVTAGLSALIISTAQAVDEQTKFARVIGTTQSELVSLQLAAQELSGVVDTQLNMALQRMTRRVAEAAVGTGEGQQAIKDLGLDAKKLASQDPAQTFRDIADAIQGVPEESERLRIAFKLFDSEGARLVTTLSAGSAALDDYADKARALGLTMTEDQARSIEIMNDSMNRLKLVFSGIGRIMALVLAPIITGIANDFEDASIKADKFSQVQGFFDGLVGALGFVGDAAKATLEAMAKLWLLATKIARGPQFFNMFTDPALTAAYDEQIRKAQEFVDALDRTLDPSERAAIWTEQMRKNFDELRANYVKGNTDYVDALRAGADQTQDIYSQLGVAIVNDFKNWNDAILQVFQATLLKMASDATGKQLRSIFSGIFETTTADTGNKALGAVLGPVLGFANGGDSTVGGSGGTDSQRVTFMATPGEKVSVRTPQQQGGGGGVTVINNNDFTGVAGVDRQELDAALRQNRLLTIAQIQDKVSRNRF